MESTCKPQQVLIRRKPPSLLYVEKQIAARGDCWWMGDVPAAGRSAEDRDGSVDSIAADKNQADLDREARQVTQAMVILYAATVAFFFYGYLSSSADTANRFSHLLTSDWNLRSELGIVAFTIAWTWFFRFVHYEILRKWAMCACLGMSQAEFEHPAWDRRMWSVVHVDDGVGGTGKGKARSLELAYYEEKFGDRPLKVADAFMRRGAHVGMIGSRLLIYMVLLPLAASWGWQLEGAGPSGASKASAVASATALPLLCRSILIIENIDGIHRYLLMKSNSWAGRVWFAGARIRDGTRGRLNYTLVSFMNWPAFLWCLMLPSFILPVADNSDTTAAADVSTHLPAQRNAIVRLFFSLAVQALLWGDTAAEVVGSLFGRIHFPVWGFGEINVKTVEGVIACFVTNFVTMVVVLFAFCPGGERKVEINHSTIYVLDFVEPAGTGVSEVAIPFRFPVMALLGWAAFVGCVAETVAPRGTDNIFITLGVMVCLLGGLHY